MRTLSFPLESLMTEPSAQRKPAYRLFIYDLRSDEGVGDTKINSIVRELTLPAIVGPREFTDDTLSIQVEEVAGDYVNLGVVDNSITLNITDPNGVFDPFNTIGSPAGDGRWLRRRNAVRLYEGDEDVAFEDWALTFTGLLVGQAGVVKDRNTGSGEKTITMQAVGRAAPHMKYEKTGVSHGIGVSYLTIANSTATADMGLDSDEIDFAGWGTAVTTMPVQNIKEPPMASLARLMFVDGFMPKFNGAGVLTQTQPLLTGISDRTYQDDSPILRVEQPASNIDPVNSVIMVGLDGALSKVTQPFQELRDLSLTTGYFNPDETINVYWSDDHTLLAEDVDTEVVRSVNGGLTFLGATETFTLIPSPNGQEGSIGMEVFFTTGFAPWLILFLTVAYIGLSWVPNEVIVAGFLVEGGITINVGSASAAIALAGALLIMSKIGRGTYKFLGVPFEFAHKEIKSIARVKNTLSADRVEITIQNHLISTQTLLDSIARDVLFEQQARGNPRSIVAIHDLAVEPNDTVTRANGRSYVISKVSRTLQRPASGIATYEAFETTPGVLP